MPAPALPLSTVPQDMPLDSREELFEALWRAWRPGALVPHWDDFLPPPNQPCTPSFVFQLLEIDVEFRVKAGLPALLGENYFQHQRLSRSDARPALDAQLELIRWEYQRRWKRGERVSRRAFCERFPEHAVALGDLRPRWNCPRCPQKGVPIEEDATGAECPRCRAVLTTAELFPSRLEPAGLDLRDYELLSPLGGGGMGQVYVSRDPGLDRLLALKVLRAEWQEDRGLERRFEDEARITGSLQHPNIVPVHNIGRLADGRLYFTMKMVRGRHLQQILDESGAERRDAHLRIFEQICQAVAYAHSKRVIHRDLKPLNVMLGRFGEVQVMDWGLAKVLVRAAPDGDTPVEASQVPASRRTEDWLQTRGSLGTPAYMAPEQANGEWERADERVDVFGLGGILCTILTGEPPYRGGTRDEVKRKAKRGDLADACTRLDACGADPDLVTLAKECLCAEMEGRPRDAAEVAVRVAVYLATVQERLRTAEKERAAAEARADEAKAKAVAERQARRLLLGLAGTLLLGTTVATALAWYANAEAGRAEKQRQVAEHKEAGARAVSKFYEENVLAAVRPKGWEGGVGKDVTLKEALDQAAPKIDEVFAGQPELEAAVRHTLGVTYWQLGHFEAANPHLEKAYSLRLKVLPPDDPDTLASLHDLALLRWRQDKLDEAIAFARQALDKRRRMLAPEHQDTLYSQLILGMFLWDQGRLDEAEEVLRPAIASCKRTLGPDHHHTLYGQNDLALVLSDKGDLPGALELHQQTLAGRRRSLAPDDPGILLSMHNVAYTLAIMGEHSEAEKMFRPALEGYRRTLGPDHFSTLLTESEMGDLLREKGDYPEAERLLSHALSSQRQTLGSDHLFLAYTLTHLGALFSETGRPERGETLLRESLTIQEKRQRAGDWSYPNTRSLLGESLVKQGRFIEAEPLLLGSYEGLLKAKGTPVKWIPKALDRIIELYEKWGKPEKAEEWKKKRPPAGK